MNDTPSSTAPAPAPAASRSTWGRLNALRARLGLSWGTLIVLTFAVIGQGIHQFGPVFKWSGWSIASVRGALWEWYIEDAAISFAYARNLFEGDGLVAFPGGERIEGYSNPTWVALMAFWHLFGVDGFTSSKFMAMALGGATVILSWLIAREVLDEDDSPAALVAPVVLAAYPQFAFWNASGLENPVFSFFLAGGLWRTLVEVRRGGYPWSSIWFLLLACSRPEGILYAAWGGFLFMAAMIGAGRGLRPTAVWLASFFVPFSIYHAIRYEYFAWAFPNTYYAKLGDKEMKPFLWTSGGWKYIRNWASGDFTSAGKEGTGAGWFLPVILAGLVGMRGRRAWLVVASSVLAALCFLYPAPEIAASLTWWPKDLPEPTWWKEGRIWLIFGMAFGLPMATLSDARGRGRLLLWGMFLIPFFFCFVSGGDWMRGFRWLSLIAVPGSVLFAAGVQQLAGTAQRVFSPGTSRWTTPGWVVAPALVLALMPSFYFHSEWFFGKRETGPFSVKKRAEYTMSIQHKLFLDDQLIRNLDVDMGAHMFWSTHLMVDMAGLVDVTNAHHEYSQREVTKMYVFDEMKPEIAHVHGGWAKSSKIPEFQEWKTRYFEIMPFEASSTTYHMGTHVRRDLVMLPKWNGNESRRVTFDDGLVLAGWRVPSPEVSQAKSFYVEVGVQYNKAEDRKDLRILGFLSDAAGHLQVFDLPPAYDWLPTAEWRPEETFLGKFAIPLQKDLEPGTYDLGFALISGDGQVFQPSSAGLPEQAVIGGRGGVPARFVAGEVRFPNVLVIGESGTGEAKAKEDFERAVDLAKGRECEDAEKAWREARLHLPKNTPWYTEHRETLAPLFADCWVELSEDAGEEEAAAKLLAKARFWDHRHAPLEKAAEEIGGLLYDRGMEALREESWDDAYRLLSAAVVANPSLSWARRYAEEARDHKLKIDPDSVERRKADAAKRAEAAKAKAAADAEEGEPAAPGEGAATPEKPPAKPPLKATPRPAAPASPPANGGEGG
jgi:hypothetical protein